jgi:hypothetical protein
MEHLPMNFAGFINALILVKNDTTSNLVSE